MTTYALSFELRADSVPTGHDGISGATDFSRCGLTLNAISLGNDFVSHMQGGTSCDCAAEWTPFTIDVTGNFDPALDNHLRLFYVPEGPAGHAYDRAHWRRINITGSDGKVYYGEYPKSYPYTEGLQDGLPGSDCSVNCWQMASDGEEPASEWSVKDNAFVTPSEGDDAIHLYFTIPRGGWLVGKVGMG